MIVGVFKYFLIQLHIFLKLPHILSVGTNISSNILETKKAPSLFFKEKKQKKEGLLKG